MGYTKDLEDLCLLFKLEVLSVLFARTAVLNWVGFSSSEFSGFVVIVFLLGFSGLIYCLSSGLLMLLTTSFG